MPVNTAVVESPGRDSKLLHGHPHAAEVTPTCFGFDYRFGILGYGLTPVFVHTLNCWTGVLHTVNAAGVLIVWISTQPDPAAPALNLTDSGAGPYLPALCFDPSARSEGGPPPFSVVPETAVTPKTYLLVIILLFFLLSAGFQLFDGVDKAAYYRRLNTNDVNALRYIEYSLSASLMMVGIACSLFVFDLYTHLLVFTCTMLCMLLGLVSDFLRVLSGTLTTLLKELYDAPVDPRAEYNDAACLPSWLACCSVAQETDRPQQQQQQPPDGNNPSGSGGNFQKIPSQLQAGEHHKMLLQHCVQHTVKLKWFTHSLSWVAISMPYICFMVSYFRSVLRLWWVCDEVDVDVDPVPGEVHAVVLTQFTLFMLFGLVQVMQFTPDKAVTVPEVGIATEFRFIMLSIVSKTLLGWLVVGNAFFL